MPLVRRELESHDNRYMGVLQQQYQGKRQLKEAIASRSARNTPLQDRG
jgi:hypothetical protein